ncbi:MAG: bifunctional DNA-formamidopyrimidine glycosylase/DNA-(apurinic or apyrimidinic site) lyase [Acidimicrobiales bacterium]
MPELPEVETVRRQLAPRLLGRAVIEAGSHNSAKFTPARAMTGARFERDDRRGKFLIFGTDDGRELIIHLGMTGKLQVTEKADTIDEESGAEESRYLRAWWRLDSQQRLDFVDVRRFGRIRMVPAGDYRSIPTLHHAGPEPFDESLDGKTFWLNLSKGRRKLKTKLLSQRPIAGVGNIYADEALWLARINPRVTRISQARATELLQAIRIVLTQGIDNGGTTLRDYVDAEGRSGENQNALEAYGRAGHPCSRCDAELTSAVIDARTSTWCPSCQRR